MVKFATAATTVLSALAGVTHAWDCTEGLYYCGSDLLSIGAYYGDIITALKDAKKSTSESYVTDSLFYCVDGGDNIDWEDYCPGNCINQGWGDSDYCK